MSGVKGRSGRKPQPTALRALKHGEGADITATTEPQPELLDRTPNPPVALDRVARAEWDRIAPELTRLHLLSNLDLSALVAYCNAFSAAAAAAKEIKRRGRYVMGANKVRVLNPAVRDQYRALEVMRSYLTEFGMSPSSRSRVVTGGGGAVGRSGKHGETEAPRPRAVNRVGAVI